MYIYTIKKNIIFQGPPADQRTDSYFEIKKHQIPSKPQACEKQRTAAASSPPFSTPSALLASPRLILAAAVLL